MVKKLLTKKHHTFESLPDKVGARVIIGYGDDVDKVTEKIRKLFDDSKEEDKRKRLGTDRVGYLCVHLEQDKSRLTLGSLGHLSLTVGPRMTRLLTTSRTRPTSLGPLPIYSAF